MILSRMFIKLKSPQHGGKLNLALTLNSTPTDHHQYTISKLLDNPDMKIDGGAAGTPAEPFFELASKRKTGCTGTYKYMTFLRHVI